MDINSNEKSEMDKLYEKYLEDHNRIYQKDGKVFYKIVKKEKLKLKGGMVLITVPWKAVNSIKDSYYDEKGNSFEIDAPVHMSFGANGIPKWYLETVTVSVKDIDDISKIGEYFGRASGEDELYEKLVAIPGSHIGFVMGILAYAKKKPEREDIVLDYLDSNSNLTVSDVVMFVSNQPDFFE